MHRLELEEAVQKRRKICEIPAFERIRDVVQYRSEFQVIEVDGGMADEQPVGKLHSSGRRFLLLGLERVAVPDPFPEFFGQLVITRLPDRQGQGQQPPLEMIGAALPFGIAIGAEAKIAKSR